MAFPIRTCSICAEEFELRPDKPGLANRCPTCSEPDDAAKRTVKAEHGSSRELNEARRKAMRDLLYRKDA